MGKPIVAALLAVLCGSAAGIVHGQGPSPPVAAETPLLRDDPSWRTRFDRDEPEFGHTVFCQLLVGSYYSTRLIGPNNSDDFDYIPLVLRLGCRPWESNSWCGDRISVMAEGLIAPIYRTYGHIMGGPSLLLRIDFVDPAEPVVPYLQLGTGFVLNDAYRNQTQRGIGECFEFLQQVLVGARWNMSDELALFAEGGLQHVSNAGMAPRNSGVNSLGASVGIEWRYGSR